MFNRSFDPSKLSYGAQYDNRQAFSGFFDQYLDSLVGGLVNDRGIRNCRIVEIGCGDGTFLRKLVRASHARNLGLGIDPSYQGAASDLDGRIEFRKSFYEPGSGALHADVVICRHVIEHVPQVMTFLRGLRQDLEAAPRSRVFFETPSLEWTLVNVVFWDFFYEHCSYFSRLALANAFALAGFTVDSVHKVFGDQYLWLEAHPGNPQFQTLSAEESTMPLIARYVKLEASAIAEWRNSICSAAERSRVALWGAGAKGVTLANILDPNADLIACLVDANPNKQGRFAAGAGHPIVRYEDLPRLGVDTVFVMNPNYRAEISKTLRAAGLALNLA